MGIYNPNRSVVLGNEWPGISYEPYPFDTETERGHTFHLDTSTTIVTGAFYVDTLPANILTYASPMISIYPAGKEANTGPVRKLIIPVNGGANISGTVGLSGGSTIAECIATAGDNKYLTYGGSIEHSIFFDTNSYSAELSGKRILNYAFLYSAVGTAPDNITNFFQIELRGTGSPTEISFTAGLEVAPEAIITPQISRVDFGNINMYTTGNLLEPRKFPMRYQDLQRWASGGSPQITLVIDSSGYAGSVDVFLTYAGLEVTYCEENRLAYGGRSPYPAGTSSQWWPLKLDQNIVHLRSVSSFTPGVTLTPGSYTVMLSLGAFSPEFDGGAKPIINALRQLYAMPAHQGVQVIRTLEPGRTPTRAEIDVLPQISLHTATAAVTGVHSYGRLVATPVYNGVSASQVILQESGGTDVQYPYVRFYARKFGDTNVPLLVSESTVGANVSLTPEAFDALPEIIAGWKEVTLTLGTPALVDDNAGTMTLTWSATNLDAGRQWEILAVDAPGSGAGALAITSPTYAQSNGLTWNSVADVSADAVAMIAQEPPVISDLAVAMEEQALESITTLECVDPMCVPTGILYNQITWSVNDVICDDFNRTSVDTWNNTPSGETWITSGASASEFNVDDGVATQSLESVNVFRSSVIDTGETNFHFRMPFSWSITNATGSSATAWFVGRYSDSQNYYSLRLTLTSSSGQVIVEIVKRVANTVSTVMSSITVGQNVANDVWDVTFHGVGNVLSGRVQNLTSGAEPITFTTVDAASSLTLGTFVGLLNRLEGGNTNTLPVTISVHSFMWALQTLDGGIELQRRDDVDDEWKTIMRSSTLCPISFSDYEARVNTLTAYRVRTFHTHNFYGQWSADLTTKFTWDIAANGAQGWVGESTELTARTTTWRHDGSGALQVTKTLGTGFDALRFNDGMGGSTRDLSADGDTLSLWALVPIGTSGVGWTAHIEVQDAGFTWQAGSNFDLTPGVWTLLTYTPAAGLLANCRAIGVQFDVTDANTTVSVIVDTLHQGNAITAIPAPGITGAGDGNSVLIFTTNEHQDGSSNLAYIMTWDNNVSEEFTFPEGDSVDLRELYQRDYVMAFMPTERGGDRFSRTLLVNNAGVATQRVTDGFRSLRDMAWDAVSYVCVRNELGDRWFANVRVPSGKIQRNRRLYLARVDITQVTDTPTQVDPTE